MANILAMKNELEQKLDKLKALSTEEVSLGAQLSKKSEELDKEIAAKEAQNKEIKELLASLDSGLNIPTANTKYKEELLRLLQEHGCEVNTALEGEPDIQKVFAASVALLNLRYSWDTVTDYRSLGLNSVEKVRQLLTNLEATIKGLAEDISRSNGFIHGELLENNYLDNADSALNLVEADPDWVVEGAVDTLRSKLNKILFDKGVKPDTPMFALGNVPKGYNYFGRSSSSNNILLNNLDNKDWAAFILDIDKKLIDARCSDYIVASRLVGAEGPEDQEENKKELNKICKIISKTDSTKADLYRALVEEQQERFDPLYDEDRREEGYQDWLIENQCVTSNNAETWIRHYVTNNLEIALLLISNEKTKEVKEELHKKEIERQAYVATGINSTKVTITEEEESELPW